MVLFQVVKVVTPPKESKLLFVPVDYVRGTIQKFELSNHGVKIELRSVVE